MNIRIELNEDLQENEVVIRCRQLDSEVQEIQRAISVISAKSTKLCFYKGETEYYLSLEQILFFETEAGGICAHTTDNVYQTKYKLYELEERLPDNFMRVSKSTILNVNRIYSITRNLTAASLVEFQNTHKQAYVSRNYYKLLKLKLQERGNEK